MWLGHTALKEKNLEIDRQAVRWLDGMQVRGWAKAGVPRVWSWNSSSSVTRAFIRNANYQVPSPSPAALETLRAGPSCLSFTKPLRRVQRSPTFENQRTKKWSWWSKEDSTTSHIRTMVFWLPMSTCSSHTSFFRQMNPSLWKEPSETRIRVDLVCLFPYLDGFLQKATFCS